MEMLQLTGVCDLAPMIRQKVSAKHSAATNTNMSRFTERITELFKDDLLIHGDAINTPCLLFTHADELNRIFNRK